MFRVESGHDRQSSSIDATPQYFGRIMQVAIRLKVSLMVASRLAVSGYKAPKKQMIYSYKQLCL